MKEDEKSVEYFMNEMTQEEFDSILKSRPQSCYETDWNKDERYILNKIRSEILEKMDKE